MDSNMKYYELGRSVPQDAQKEIIGGKLKGKTDINPMWRIKKLTEMFGPVGFGWTCRITDKWLEEKNGEVACFVRCELRVKGGDVWSEPIEGIGGNMFVAKTSNGLQTNDECYKMAYTDAISVACKSLGIGADIYWKSDATKYTDAPSSPGAIVTPQAAKIVSPENKTSKAKNVEEIEGMSLDEYFRAFVQPEIEQARTPEDLNKIWQSYPALMMFGEFTAAMSRKKEEIKKQMREHPL